MPSMSDREKHRVFTQALRGVRPGEKVKIPKKAMRSLPRSYEGTMVGTPPSLVAEGAREQYRGPYNRHVYETADSWVVHRDSVDPRQDPIGHLATDAPEWGAGFLAAGVFHHFRADDRAFHARRPDPSGGVAVAGHEQHSSEVEHVR